VLRWASKGAAVAPKCVSVAPKSAECCGGPPAGGVRQTLLGMEEHGRFVKSGLHTRRERPAGAAEYAAAQVVFATTGSRATPKKQNTEKCRLSNTRQTYRSAKWNSG
jgi:hypothetical protein